MSRNGKTIEGMVILKVDTARLYFCIYLYTNLPALTIFIYFNSYLTPTFIADFSNGTDQVSLKFAIMNANFI